jgi:hypothetical protein
MSDSDTTSIIEIDLPDPEPPPATGTDAAEEPPPNYSVRLLMDAHADDPVAAVEQFLERVLEFGLRGWAFAVVDYDTDVMSYVEDQVNYTIEEFREKLAQEDASGPAS